MKNPMMKSNQLISKPALKDVMNDITVLEDYSLFSNFGAKL